MVRTLLINCSCLRNRVLRLFIFAEDNNTRVVFERILNAEQLTPDKAM